MPEQLTIREAAEEDVEVLFALILELADYEKLRDKVNGDAEILRRSLFEERTAQALLAEIDGEAGGYAIPCGTFSSFECRAGVWIEDIYVRPESRRAGVGHPLFAWVARRGVARGARRVEWAVLDWNRLALDFYEELGATGLDEWRMMRLGGGGGRGGGAPAGASRCLADAG